MVLIIVQGVSSDIGSQNISDVYTSFKAWRIISARTNKPTFFRILTPNKMLIDNLVTNFRKYLSRSANLSATLLYSTPLDRIPLTTGTRPTLCEMQKETHSKSLELPSGIAHPQIIFATLKRKAKEAISERSFKIIHVSQ